MNDAARSTVTLPVLDVSDLSADASRRAALGRQMARVCETTGFFYIVGHGIGAATREAMFDLTRSFFALPAVQRQALSMAGNAHWRGYLPMKMLGKDDALKGNELEAFHVWPEFPADEPRMRAGTPLFGPTPWPAALPRMRGMCLAYTEMATALVMKMMGAMALGLDLPEDTFSRHFRQPMSLLRLIHYPPQREADTRGLFGTRPHTDNGTFTLLAQDDVGGLEILGPGDTWIDVPPIADSFVINLGEMMKVWSNGRFLATPHRVVNRSGRERYSIPFFLNPDYDAVIEPLVARSADRTAPSFHTTVGFDEHATCGEILTRLYRRIWPSLSGTQSG